MTPLARCQLLTEDDYLAKTEEFGDEFSASMGAEGIRDLLNSLDIRVEIETVRREMESTGSETKLKKLSKRLKILEAFNKSGIKPEWMILTVLPVLPPELRPLVPKDVCTKLPIGTTRIPRFADGPWEIKYDGDW